MNLTTNSLPESGFLRLTQIIGDPKADPPIPPIIPVCRATVYNLIKRKAFPAPVYPFGPRITLFRVEDIRAFIQQMA